MSYEGVSPLQKNKELALADITEEQILHAKTLSPKLYNFLIKEPREEFIQGILSFLLVEKFGGNKELFFSRDKGVSYNPRAARLVSITRQYYRDEDYNFYTSLILSSLFYLRPMDVDIESACGKLITEELLLSLKELQIFSLSIENQKPIMDINCVITNKLLLINFLDRMRHAHLTQFDILKCFDLFPEYRKLIPASDTEIASTFDTWHKRSRISLSASYAIR